MANKAAAKASAAWAARAKKEGKPVRRETRCHCGTMISLGAVGRHNCSSKRFNASSGLPATEKSIFKASLSEIVFRAEVMTSKRSPREIDLVRAADRSKDYPARLPQGWRNSF